MEVVDVTVFAELGWQLVGLGLDAARFAVPRPQPALPFRPSSSRSYTTDAVVNPASRSLATMSGVGAVPSPAQKHTAGTFSCWHAHTAGSPLTTKT